MSKIIGIDTANIDNIAGLGTGGGGGEAHVLTTPSSGVIAFGGLSLGSFPFDWADFFSDIPTFGYEVSSTSFDKVKVNDIHLLALDSSGNLYHKTAYNNNSYKWGNTTYNVLEQVLTGVSKFEIGNNGSQSFALALKTNGELWGVGYNYFYTLGLGTNADQTSWVRIGTESDWKDISVGSYNSYALKGGATDTYLYATGRNNNGATGQGTTSGSTTSFTRVKSGATTDWSENLNYSAGSFKFAGASDGCMVINTSGELFMFGRANQQFPVNLDASISTYSAQTYVVQIGTDQNWQQVVAGDYDSAFRKNSGQLYACGNTSGFNGVSSSYHNITQVGSTADFDAFDDTISHGYGRGQSSARVFKKAGVLKIWGSPSSGGWNSPTTNISDVALSSLNSFPTSSTVNSVAILTAGSNSTMIIVSVS